MGIGPSAWDHRIYCKGLDPWLGSQRMGATIKKYVYVCLFFLSHVKIVGGASLLNFLLVEHPQFFRTVYLDFISKVRYESHSSLLPFTTFIMVHWSSVLSNLRRWFMFKYFPRRPYVVGPHLPCIISCVGVLTSIDVYQHLTNIQQLITFDGRDLRWWESLIYWLIQYILLIFSKWGLISFLIFLYILTFETKYICWYGSEMEGQISLRPSSFVDTFYKILLTLIEWLLFISG